MDHSFWTFLVAITLLTITPGVDTLLVIRNTARGGFADGLVSSGGICCGLFVHATLSAVGIALILLQSAYLFALLKLVGAGYLIWLGASSLHRATRRNGTRLHAGAAQGIDFKWQRSFLEGFLSNVLNPKTIIFYMAFLPQFILPEQAALPQSLRLAAIHFGVAMFWQTVLALLVLRAHRWLQQDRAGRVIAGLSGGVLTLLGLRLALER